MLKNVTHFFIEDKLNHTFSQRLFSNPNSVTSDEFFNQISEKVDLTQLYKVKETCFYHDQMDFTPILLEIMDSEIIEKSNDCKYLLQVWNEWSERCYEKQLKGVPMIQSICYDFLVFIPSQEDEDCNCIHIMQIENKYRVVIENILEGEQIKHIAYNSTTEYLTMSTDKELIYVKISKDKLTKGEDDESDSKNEVVNRISIDQSEIMKIQLDLKIKAILLNHKQSDDDDDDEDGKEIQTYIVFETLDNQLDFNSLDINEETYHFTQAKELIPRENNKFTIDPITLCDFIFVKGVCFAYAQRTQGYFDLYYDMARSDSPDKIAIQIAMNFKAFYLKIENDQDPSNPLIYQIKTTDNKAEFSIAQKISSNISFDDIIIQKVSKVKQYGNFQISQIKRATVVQISHGYFISTFDLVQQEWISHEKYDKEIICLFKTQRWNGNKWKMCFAAYLEEGEQTEIRYLDFEAEEHKVIQIDGEIIQFEEDQQTNEFVYFCVKKEETVSLKVLYKEKIYDIEVEGMGDDPSLIVVKNQESQPIIVIQSENTKLQVYKLKVENPNEDEEEYQDTEYTLSLEKLCDFKKTKGEFDDLGWCFCAVTVNIGEDLILTGWYNIFIINLKEETLTTYENQNIIGIQFFSSHECYAICDASDTLPPGLRLYNFKRILEAKECKCLPIKRFDVGGQGDLEFSKDIGRIGFIISVTDLVLTPLLHRNTIRFFGMNQTKDYIAYKVEKDNMITLNKHNSLQQWDIISGKLIQSADLPEEQDYSNFTLYSYYKAEKVILYSSDLEQDVNEQQFYQDWQLKTNIPNQKAFVSAQEKQIMHWKVIRIENENKVTEELSFFHPKYETEQRLFFSNDYQYMIEKLANQRMFLYKAQYIHREKLGNINVKWQFIRKIEDHPTDLEIDHEVLNVYSPNFLHSIDVDREKLVFIIRDAITNKVLYEVPQEIMKFNVKEEETQSIMSRFTWLTDNTFKIMNIDGMEKTIDLDNFKILDYKIIPLLEKEQWQEHLFYVRQSQLEEQDILKRLKRKHQMYRGSQEANLFTVDEHQFDFTDHSFTYLHWSLIEQIKNKDISFKDLDSSILESLAFIILPGGNTLFHNLLNQEKLLLDLYELAHPEVDGQTTIKYYIPILQNVEGETFIHQILSRWSNKSINTLLTYLKLYEVDHHSKQLKDVLPQFISWGLADLFPYLNSRIIEISSANFTKDERGTLEAANHFNIKEDQNQDEKINVKCEILDMPQIYHLQDEHFQQLFETLAESEDYQLFSLKPIQKLIEYNYPPVKDYTIRRLFFPYIIFLTIFTYFTTFIFHQESHTSFTYQLYLILLGLFTTYFISNEIRQIIINPISYFTSIWNYIDILPTFGIYTLILFSFFSYFSNPDIVITSTILSVTSFFMWFKFLYFLRLFKSTSYLIHMIIEVVIDMRHFLLVLFITILAFSNSLLIISFSNPANTLNSLGEEENNGRFIGGFVESITYTYRMILGDFSTDEFGNNSLLLVWILFILCTIFNMIVMLNLLIAIISESFGKVNSNAEMAAFRVKAQIIAENNYLMPDSAKEEYAIKNGYLVIKTVSDSEEKTEADPVKDSLNQMMKFIEVQNREIKSLKGIIDDMQSKTNENTKSQVDSNQQIMKTLTSIQKSVKSIKKNKSEDKDDEKEKKDEGQEEEEDN